MYRILDFFIGLLFGLGLLLSGMSDPAKVLAFLDLAGAWDPSLAFVMLGALALGLIAFALARRRSTSLLGQPLLLPSSRPVDAPLWVGAVLFGVGWGLAGFCPAPALLNVATGEPKVIVFVTAMLAGMWAASQLHAR